MIRTDFPTPPNFEVRFGRYTLRDVLRIGFPTLVGWFIAGLAGMAVGGTVGVAMAEVEVREKHLDEHVADIVRERVLQQPGTRLSVDAVWRDKGVAELSNGTTLGVVHVESVELRNSDDATQTANRDTVLDLLKEIEYPVEIHSPQRLEDLSPYSGVDGTGVVTDHFVVVKAYPMSNGGLWPAAPEPQDNEQRIETVQDRCRKIQDALTGGDMSASWLTGDELAAVLNRFAPDGVAGAPIHDTGEELAVQQVAAVSRFPPKPPIQWLADVLNVQTSGVVDIVQVVEPVTEKQRTRLDRMMGRLRGEIFGEDRPSRKTRLERIYDDYQDLQDAEVVGERLVNYGVYIVARGTDESEASATMDEVRRVLRRFRAETWTPKLRTQSAEKTVSPLHHDLLGRTQIVPARAAASGFPFAAYDTIEDGGVVFGTDTNSGLPLVLERYGWEAGHIARMGKIGSGKSYAAKLVLLRSIERYDDVQVFIIDPKSEYGAVSAAVNGQHVIVDDTDLSAIDTVNGGLLRYTVADRSQDNTDQLVNAVRDVYRRASQDTTKTVVLIDETHRLLRNPEGRTVLGELVREGRDRNVAVTMITQNASDFTRSQEGRDILKNVNGYVFMRHQDVDTGVQDFFNLSAAEAVQLRKLRTGTEVGFSEAVIRGPVNTTLRIESTDEEHTVITDESKNDTELKTMSDTHDTSTEPSTNQPTEKSETAGAASSRTDGGTTTQPTTDHTTKGVDGPDSTEFRPSTSDGATRSQSGSSTAWERRQLEKNDAFMELPDTSVTEIEDLDEDAAAEEMLPDVLPGWERQTTSTDRWAVPVAEDWIAGRYIDAFDGRYVVHVSRWKSEHVTYAIDELFGKGEPVRFDVWAVRGCFVFGVVNLSGTVRQAKTLLTAIPALSESYLDEERR